MNQGVLQSLEEEKSKVLRCSHNRLKWINLYTWWENMICIWFHFDKKKPSWSMRFFFSLIIELKSFFSRCLLMPVNLPCRVWWVALTIPLHSHRTEKNVVNEFNLHLKKISLCAPSFIALINQITFPSYFFFSTFYRFSKDGRKYPMKHNNQYQVMEQHGNMAYFLEPKPYFSPLVIK